MKLVAALALSSAALAGAVSTSAREKFADVLAEDVLNVQYGSAAVGERDGDSSDGKPSSAAFTESLTPPYDEDDKLLGLVDLGGHHATNPDAVWDGFPDCSVPDQWKQFYTECAPAEDYATKPSRLAILGTSFTAGVGVMSKSDTWPSKLAEMSPTTSVTNLGAGGSTILRPESGGPFHRSYWNRPQWRAFKANTWDSVLIMMGHNDAKKAFWPDSCSNSTTLLTACPVTIDLLEMIKIAKTRGRDGRIPKVMVALEANPTCCQEGARTCGMAAGSGCGAGYCLACESAPGENGGIVNMDGRHKWLPRLLKGVAKQVGVPLITAGDRATAEVPLDQCKAKHGLLEAYLPEMRKRGILEGCCPGGPIHGGLPVPETCCKGKGCPCCTCHGSPDTANKIAAAMHSEFKRVQKSFSWATWDKTWEREGSADSSSATKTGRRGNSTSNSTEMDGNDDDDDDDDDDDEADNDMSLGARTPASAATAAKVKLESPTATPGEDPPGADASMEAQLGAIVGPDRVGPVLEAVKPIIKAVGPDRAREGAKIVYGEDPIMDPIMDAVLKRPLKKATKSEAPTGNPNPRDTEEKATPPQRALPSAQVVSESPQQDTMLKAVGGWASGAVGGWAALQSEVGPTEATERLKGALSEAAGAIEVAKAMGAAGPAQQAEVAAEVVGTAAAEEEEEPAEAAEESDEQVVAHLKAEVKGLVGADQPLEGAFMPLLNAAGITKAKAAKTAKATKAAKAAKAESTTAMEQ